MEAFEKYICIFFAYSIAGWFMETIRGWIKTKKFVNRGFLIGPCLPIYGFGLVLLTLTLEKYTNDIFVLFGMSIILCGILEYFTSWIMEKVFKARWWDYHNRKFNINGRVCLETLLPFGIAGTVLLKFANPYILLLFEKVPTNILYWILGILSSIFILDIIISFTVIGKIRKTARDVENEVKKDNTEEISNIVKDVTTEKAKEFADTMTIKIEDAKNTLNEIPKKFDSNIKLAQKKMSSIRNELKQRITTTAEFTEAVKNRLLKENWLIRRFTKAFPNLQLKPKVLKLKDRND